MNMQSFQFTSQINREGIVQLPAAYANQKVEIVLVVHFEPQSLQTERPTKN